jgi:uncharacterized BrkB/YihY/UPF0761 family membrane protein
MRAMTLEQQGQDPGSASGSTPAVEGQAAESGRIRRTVAWSKTTAGRAGAWAEDARGRHASVDVGYRVADRDRHVAAMVLAGGLAYRIFFWVLALALVASGVLGLFDPAALQADAANQGLSKGLASAVGDLARTSSGNSWWLLLVGGWLVLWTGYTCSKALVLTHAAVWHEHPPRITRPLRASLVFTGGTLGFMAAMVGARWVREHNGGLGLLTTLLVFAIPFGFWLLASLRLPNRAHDWVELVPGALVVAVGLQAMHIFTAYFLGPKLTSATQLYGVIGIATTVLFWFYIAGRLIIGAATLNASFAERRAADRAAAAATESE